MKEKKQRQNSYDELPLILDVSHIQQIMGISRVGAYELVHSQGFPAIRHGRLIKVSKRALFNWIENGQGNNSNGKFEGLKTYKKCKNRPGKQQ